MSEFRIDQIKSQDASRGPDIAGITTFTGTSGIVMPSGDTAYRGGRGRAVFGGGATPTVVNTIQYITIATLGNASDFGDLSYTVHSMSACASSTRGLFGSGFRGTTPLNVYISDINGNYETYVATIVNTSSLPATIGVPIIFDGANQIMITIKDSNSCSYFKIIDC